MPMGSKSGTGLHNHPWWSRWTSQHQESSLSPTDPTNLCPLQSSHGSSEPHPNRVERQDINPSFQGPIFLVILILSARNFSILHNGKDELCCPNPGFSITFCPQEIVCFGNVTRAVQPVKSNLFDQREFCIW